MNLKTLLVCALLVGCMSIGFATAVGPPSDEINSEINATIEKPYAMIKAPILTPWELKRGVDYNEYDAGPVEISTNLPAHTFEMYLDISGDLTKWGFAVPVQVSADGSDWTSFATSGTWFKLGSYDAMRDPPKSIPVLIRQVVTNEEDDEYKLVLTYTLTVSQIVV